MATQFIKRMPDIHQSDIQSLKNFNDMDPVIPSHFPEAISICYRVSMGEDISFDAGLKMNFGTVVIRHKKKVLKFNYFEKKNYSSHSFYLFKESTKFTEAPDEYLSHLIEQLDHQPADQLRIGIGESEYKVINISIEDNRNVKGILAEFNKAYHTKDKIFLLRIKKSFGKLSKARHATSLYCNNYKNETSAPKKRCIYGQLKKSEVNA